MQQQSLFKKEELRYVKSWSHGGSSLKKRRKIKRPLLPKKKIHVVFKSRFSTGRMSLLAQKQRVNALLKERAKKYFITIHETVNMGNHLHLKVSCLDTKALQNFLRTFAALLARKITNSYRGKSFGKFWSSLVFTRVLHSSYEELGLKGYFEANRRQKAQGSKARAAYLNQFNSFLRNLKTVKAHPLNESQLVLSLE